VGLGALGDVDGMLCPFGEPARAESGVDGLASPAQTSTTPRIASPPAIEALTSSPLGYQRDELNISFDPPREQRSGQTIRTACGRAPGSPGAYRVSGSSGSGSRPPNAVVPQNCEATFG
jgi:hypothetical protein